MATSKKKSPGAKVRRAPSAKASPKAVKAPASAAPAAVPAASRKSGKLWVVPVCMATVLVLVGLFLVLHARYLASLKFDMVRNAARIVPQGHDAGETTTVTNMSGDPQGHTFALEFQPNVPGRLQRFDQQESADSLVYKPRGRGQDLTAAVDVDCDNQGTVYVLLTDGRVQVLSNDLKYERTISTGLPNCTALSIDSGGRIFVADQPENKVVLFSNDGRRTGEFGAPGGTGISLVQPTFLRVAKDDEVVVIEKTDTGMRGRVFAKDLTLRKTFLVDKLTSYPPDRLGLNGQLKAFFNDAGGSSGIDCWDITTGRYFGSAQATKDGVQFINPGCIGANRFTPDVYVHTIAGLVKCVLPAPGEEQK